MLDNRKPIVEAPSPKSPQHPGTSWARNPWRSSGTGGVPRAERKFPGVPLHPLRQDGVARDLFGPKVAMEAERWVRVGCVRAIRRQTEPSGALRRLAHL